MSWSRSDCLEASCERYSIQPSLPSQRRLGASCSLASCFPGFVLPSGYAEWARMEESDTSFSLSGCTGGPSDQIDVDDVDELSGDNSRAPLASLTGTKLEWSTVVSSLTGTETAAVTLTQMSTALKTCVFCRLSYTGGPNIIRNHLDAKIVKRHNKACTPSAAWFHRHAQVLKILRQRADDESAVAKVKTLKAKARSLVMSDSAVSLVGQGTIQTMRPSTAQVTEQWMRALVRNGLAMHIVDDPEFRAAITMTARAGQSFVDARVDGDCKLPHRMHMMYKELPLLDDKLHDRVSKKISGLLKETGGLIISDGWTSTSKRPIVNALLCTPAGSQFLKAVDASGEFKGAKFIADFINDIIEDQGAKNIVAVCMDGACVSSFPLILNTFEHVFCYICPAHTVDNFLKNVCGDTETIKVRSIDKTFPWDSDIFSSPIAQAWEVIKFITNHGKALHLFR